MKKYHPPVLRLYKQAMVS